MFFLVCLALLNGYIISRGATNIELKSMNVPCISNASDVIKKFKNQHLRLFLKFIKFLKFPKNPYDLGFKNNWKTFLGFDDLK